MGELLNTNMLNKIMNKIMPHKITTFIYALIKPKENKINKGIQNGAKTIKKAIRISMLLLNSLYLVLTFFYQSFTNFNKINKIFKISRKNQEKIKNKI